MIEIYEVKNNNMMDNIVFKVGSPFNGLDIIQIASDIEEIVSKLNQNLKKVIFSFICSIFINLD